MNEAKSETLDAVGSNSTTTTTIKDEGDVSLNTIYFDRRPIKSESTNAGDLCVLADAAVTVYDASTLEQGLFAQANVSIINSKTEWSSIASGKPATKPSLNEVVIETHSSVQCGESTPFEMIRAGHEAARHEESIDLDRIKHEESVGQEEDVVQDGMNVDKDSDEGSEYKPESDDAEEESEEEAAVMNESFDDGKKPPHRIRAESKGNVTKLRRLRDDANDKDFDERVRSAECGASEGGSSHELKSGVRVPAECWLKLYKYQRTGVRWLNELHDQCVGGILSDEMGLGKTIQVICFLRALAFSQLESRGFGYKGLGPVLLVCPTTLMHQWLKEFRVWFAQCRVGILHSSGSYRGSPSALVHKFSKYHANGCALLTSYSTFTKQRKLITSANWHYVILDEGHKIRNPSAQITIAIKEVRTPHRLILTGSPLQNSLKELWSLMDFVYPGRLGALQTFTDRFAIPITQGGYANANAVQVRTAFKCACVLRDAINPYILRRMKKDVEMAIQLPPKTEQVLFCDITRHQRSLYKDYISSRECARILSGRMDAFVGLISLRKLCNHPDLVTGGPNKYNEYDVAIDEDMEFGAACRSGKMMVLKSLLKLWKDQQQKVLLFSQSRQMLTVLEKFIIKEGYEYLRMDGSTSIASRQPLVERFNSDHQIFVFLLTTRVGGLGINLTGANRVVIFDPDWNPSTDIQARERAWRIGQDRAVTIYRLLTSGTIEEKIYHRQIFKQFLANRILVDPKQRRFFKTNDLYELFSLGDEKTIKAKGTETASIFSGTAEEINRNNYFDINEKERHRKASERKKKANKVKKGAEAIEIDSDSDEDVKQLVEQVLSAEKIAELKRLARKISRSIGKNKQKEGEHDKGDELQSSSASTSKKERQKERHSKRRRKSLLDGRYEIPYLKKQSQFKENSKDGSEEVDAKAQNDYVLRKLLSNAGVHSAFRHDQIFVEGTADYQLIEDEADSVAKRAAASLRRSRRFVMDTSNDSSIGGSSAKKQRFGTKKTNNSKMNAVYDENEQRNESDADDTNDEGTFFNGNKLSKESSMSLLDAIRARKEKTLDEDDDLDALEYPSLLTSVEASSSTETKKHDRFGQLADDIRCFLAVRDGRASTDEIVQKFRNEVPVQDTSAFRSILKRLCTFRNETRFWILRDEYR
ncbi:unnamed protein product [Anisakis simplex]|uniref:DNA repair and recombination protein RAD54-like n=1 Tax=Anisakis simplex TaxID=6269 RepID=A0A158PPJ4_ANISI|nr:unnamed protein product [Anisakis simplex]